MTRPLVYVAGPYTHPDPVDNTAHAIAVATRLLDSGHVAPIVPHLTMFWHLLYPHDYETWLALDFDHLRRCDALLRIAGDSAGADREVNFARGFGIAIFYDVEACIAWAMEEAALR